MFSDRSSEFNEREIESSFHWWRLWATLYIAFLLVIKVALWYADEWLPGYLILYAPALAWLLPVLPIAVGAAFRDRKALALVAFAISFWLFYIAGLEINWPNPEPTGGKVLKVLTNNVGEDNDTDVLGFWKEENPDFLVLQDTYKKGAFYRKAFEGYHFKAVDQHFLVSRYPILSAKPIRVPEWPRVIAVCFEVEVEGKKIHLYSVHTPTARREFADFWYGDRQKNPLPKRIEIFNEAMNRRRFGMQRFAEILLADPEPVLAVGDFNMPAWGSLHRQLENGLQDAFEECGRGFGYTFPSYDPYLPTWFGPWLRIDYAFCNKAWRPLSCRVENDRATQHRAISATFELTR